MRTKVPLLDALFPRVRQNILTATLLHPDRSWYLSDLADHIGVTPSTLQRELASLVGAGILVRRPEGRRVYFRADPRCPVLNELAGLLRKTAGLADPLRSMLENLGKSVDWAFVYGSVARGEERSGSDVDLLVIGGLGLADLAEPLRGIEKTLGRSVNPTVYGRDEFEQKLANGDHFLAAVMSGPKLMLCGDEDELGRLGA